MRRRKSPLRCSGCSEPTTSHVAVERVTARDSFCATLHDQRHSAIALTEQTSPSRPLFVRPELIHE